MKRLDWQSGNVQPCVMALGYFDGVHLGHRAVIEAAVLQAHRLGCGTAVFTFTDKAGACMQKSAAGRIYRDETRQRLLESLGVDFLLMPDFGEVSKLLPEQFVSELTGRFAVRAVTAGSDFRFGRDKSGDFSTLRSLAAQAGIDAFEVPQVCLDGAPVSSTRIRQALIAGDMEGAARLLGRPYCIDGPVVGGKHLGTRELFPTANQHFLPGQLIPRCGVYAARAVLAGRSFAAVTNIGTCPTVSEENTVSAETYLLGEQFSLYGQPLTVELLHYLRPEQKFASIEALRAQIETDISAAKTLFETL